MTQHSTQSISRFSSSEGGGSEISYQKHKFLSILLSMKSIEFSVILLRSTVNQV